MTTYTLAGGCFWCIDAVFRRLKGVESSLCGYAGGNEKDAQYYTVSTGKTAHAESVQVTFNETIIPKETILDIFFFIHNPTTKNRQGNDIGPQYRSVVFYEGERQKADFRAAIQRASPYWDEPIVTELVPLEAFYEAEPEHKDYFTKNPMNGYCSIVITPKVVKARKAYKTWFKEEG